MRDNAVLNGAPYCEGQRIRSWNLPPDFVTLEPANKSARIIDDFNRRVFTHPLRPRSAMSRHGPYLPGILSGPGDNATGPLCELSDAMPRYERRGTLLDWPTRHDRPENEAAELVLAYWRRHRKHPDLPAHGAWNLLTGSVWLPPLPELEQPQETALPPGFGTPSPSNYVGLDGRTDSPLVAAVPPPPVIRTRTVRETRAVQRGELDPTGRR
jgi:hypothetical protein